MFNLTLPTEDKEEGKSNAVSHDGYDDHLYDETENDVLPGIPNGYELVLESDKAIVEMLQSQEFKERISDADGYPSLVVLPTIASKYIDVATELRLQYVLDCDICQKSKFTFKINEFELEVDPITVFEDAVALAIANGWSSDGYYIVCPECEKAYFDGGTGDDNNSIAESDKVISISSDQIQKDETASIQV